MRPLLIVDGDNLAHRAYHSSPKTIVGSDGKPANAISGFFSMLGRIYAEEQPRGVFVAWDTLGVDTYRNTLWPPYQGGRVFEPDIVRQLDMLPAVCAAFGFGTAKRAGYEADDLIASAVCAELAAGGVCLVLTTDKDSYQLVNEQVTVLAPKRGTRELDRITPHEVVARLGVLPEQVPDFKALCGDSSDKIPGIASIGPKTAASLLLRHGSLDAVLEARGRIEDQERANMFRDVVTMRPDTVVVLPEGAPDWRGGAESLRKLGLEGLADRLAQLDA